MSKKPMPRLSTDLPGRVDPRICQSCDQETDVTIWQEHDESDQPEAVFVALCAPCSDRIIVPHPRLYEPLQKKQPVPGIMAICLPCRHRNGTSCRSPLGTAQGGLGLEIACPEPGRVYFDGRRGPKGGRRHGWSELIYWDAPTACSGFETIG